VDYASVLSVFLVAAVAGVLTHVPAGLGVLEAVFMALLSQRIAAAELLAALLAYRALYYLVPLAVAVPILLLIEAGAGRSAAQAGAPARASMAGRKAADGGRAAPLGG
jgi:hypothetical protein